MGSTGRMEGLRIGLAVYALRCGGVATFLFRLGRFLSREGAEVELVTTEEPGDWFERAERYGIAAHHVAGAAERSRLRHAKRVGDFLASRGYDALLLNHSQHAQRAIGKLPDRVFVVAIVHGDTPPVYRVAASNRHAWNVMVAPGPKVSSAAQLEVPDRPVLLIPHGVAIPLESELRLDRRKGDPLRVAFVGRLDRTQKGIELLPRILSACRGRGVAAEVRIAGDGPDRPFLEEALQREEAADRATFLGPLDPEEVYRLLLETHLLLFPSTREAFGLVPLEAQACGCVPICSHLRGVTDATVEEERTGFLVPVGDAEAFAERIAFLDRDRDAWERVARTGYASVSDHFPLERMGASYRDLILRGLDGGYPLRRSRRWRAGIDLESLPGQGFIPQGVRRVARWIRERSER
ncbi:MAG: glycosyltransferase [Candidatus Eisenbacteria bacterium]|nr:glycosyltransferase [Candidatus Latescibacterota bacterium]MBD3301902.1 glycosyltransferase [Candidatus Eisenbacteria bacterium]